ncbi:MAG: SCO4402 family protein [Acidimicrobiales bacterium]
MVCSVIAVKFPAMRREVMRALAALADQPYQQQVWFGHKYPHEDYFDDLTVCVHILYDDAQVLPEPSSRVGSVLLDGDELARLRQLGAVLDVLLESHGDAPDVEYLSDLRWANVARSAGLALAAMVRGWGFND